MRTKLQHFKDNADSDLVIESGKQLYYEVSGHWHEVFGNKNPIVLELGCGRGAYTIALAQQHPEWNVIGVDIKGDRLWYGAQKAKEFELKNVCFLRARIEQIEEFFSPGEVHEIWITFPDPHPKKRSINRRMTNARFLRRYADILKDGGLVHVKTDSQDFHLFTKHEVHMSDHFKIIIAMTDIADLPSTHILQSIQTQYESRYRLEGRQITYIQLQRMGVVFRILNCIPIIGRLTKRGR